MISFLFWVAVLALGGAAVVGISLAMRRYSQRSGEAPRIEVVEFANLDNRRKLVLVRRDDVEHLIMTGGPVDVVVETGIALAARPRVHEAIPVAKSAHKEPDWSAAPAPPLAQPPAQAQTQAQSRPHVQAQDRLMPGAPFPDIAAER